jgi:3D (Asp-Asp-Asp) domain-containing protein
MSFNRNSAEGNKRYSVRCLLSFVLAISTCAESSSSQFSFPPPPDLSRLQKITITVTQYHIFHVRQTGDIPLLDGEGRELGPKLSLHDFCHAANEGTTQVGSKLYNVRGPSSRQQADCTKVVNRDVGSNRFALARGPYGDGIGNNILVPYRTLATNTTVIRPGTALFIPAACGKVLPGGLRHDGYFFAADKGQMRSTQVGNITTTQVDVFQGYEERNLAFIDYLDKKTVTSYVITDPKIVAELKSEHRLKVN